jgi:hypothetical protein
VIRRLPQIAFGLLALATLAAFFLVQTLKTAPPLLWTLPLPQPSAINPLDGRSCVSRSGQLIDYRHTTITLSISHPDTVGVYIVSAKNPAGETVATVSSGTPMLAGPRPGDDSRTFTWNGLLADGQPAPDGTYLFRVVLEHQGRSANLSTTPVQVLTQPPAVRILSVRLLGRPAAASTTSSTNPSTTAPASTPTGGHGSALVPLPGPAVIASPHSRVRITYTPGVYRRVWIDIYRTDTGTPELVDRRPVPFAHLVRAAYTWNGEIGGAPAPAGTYLIGITAQDVACNRTIWPAHIPPAPGSTAHAGVSVRYLSVFPPLTPTASGARVGVPVDSPGAPFTWRLRQAGSPTVVARGSGSAGSTVIHVRMPRRRAGLYTLTVSAATQSAAVPLIAYRAGAAAAHARVLVVLPVLTWLGNAPVDDTGDGLPDTLRAGRAVSLARPLIDGPPAGSAADAALLSYLTAHHLSYQLTTDVALADGAGPSLADRGGVVLPEGEAYLPEGLAQTLRGFAQGGGRVLVLGSQSLLGTTHISGFPRAPQASAPRLTPTDPFGARRGQVTPTLGELISVTTDPLSLFAGAGSFGGFSQYQPIEPPAHAAATGSVSTAGIGSAAPAVIAFHQGSGTVVEVGIVGFAASLASNADSQTFLHNVWQLLSQ